MDQEKKDRPRMESADGVQDNIEKIAALFPDCVTEARDEAGRTVRRIDGDKLLQNLSGALLNENDERYMFTWPNKRRATLLANRPIRATLRPAREESVDFDSTRNLYIEGDNLDVLKLLKEAYYKSVKMIYIDPPYNTGNDFVYRDNYAQSAEEYRANSGQYDEQGNRLSANTESNGRFHTDWLNMIYPRLRLAHDMLTDDGVIFISIDDHEVANLRKVCDEVFGEGNFVLQIAWRRTDNQPNVAKVARVKEYIIVYARNINEYSMGKMPLSDKAKKEYRYSDEKGLFRRAILLHKTRGRKFYPRKTLSGKILNGPWMVSEQEFDRMDANGEIYWTSGGDEQPYGKIYLEDSKGQVPSDFWGIEYGTNQRASLEVEALFKKRYFDFPKPVSLINTIVKLGCTSPDSLVLDFFSGSATTAHAVMQLNAEDGGHRRYICVQLPEETPADSEARRAGYATICEIGKERIRRAAAKIKADSPLTTLELDTGFRVLRLESTNMLDVYYKTSATTQGDLDLQVDNVKPGRTDEDLLFQVMLANGIKLDSTIERHEVAGSTVWSVGEGRLVACLAPQITEEVVVDVAKRKPELAVLRNTTVRKDQTVINIDAIFRKYSFDTNVKLL